MKKITLVLGIVALLIAFSSAVYANRVTLDWIEVEDKYLLNCNLTEYAAQAYEYVFYINGVNVSSGVFAGNGTFNYTTDIENNAFKSAGSFTVPNPWESFVDENKVTSAVGFDADASVRVFYENHYVINANAAIKTGAGEFDVALPTACFNESEIQLNYYANAVTSRTNLICHHHNYDNNNTWSSFLYDPAEIPSDIIYEENITIVANYSSYPSAYNVNVLNYTGGGIGAYSGSCRALKSTNTTEQSVWFNATPLYGNLSIQIKDEDTQNIIDTEEITVEIVAENFSEIYTTSTGVFYSPIAGLVLNGSVPEGSEFETRYYSDTRLLRTSFFTASTVNENKTLYMLNDTTSDNLDVIVRDFSLLGIPDAYITVERWYSNLSQYVAIAEGKTNNLGSTRFYLHKDNAYYRFLVEYNNITIFTSTGEIVTGDTDTYRINTDTSSVYTAWSDLSGDMTYSNSTGTPTFSFTYEGKLDNIDSVTIEMYINNSIGDLVLNGSNTSTATDDTITLKVTDIESYYVAFVYITYTSGDFAYLDNEYKEFFPRLTSTQEDWIPIILFISIILFPALVLGLLTAIKKLIAIPIAVALFVLIMSFNPFFVLFPRVIATLIIFGCIFIAYYLNKNTV